MFFDPEKQWIKKHQYRQFLADIDVFIKYFASCLHSYHAVGVQIPRSAGLNPYKQKRTCLTFAIVPPLAGLAVKKA
jgi:hypothetical protein